jgi:adenine phosphoribosyltransferase
LVEDLIHPFAKVEFDCVAGIDALGFILGAAIAVRLEKGFVPIRKGGKLPVPTDRAEFVDYTEQKKSLELRIGAIRAGTRVLVVDEWIETGAQIQAAIELLEKQGGVVIGIATINMEDNAVTRLLRDKYQCHAVWRDD